MTKKMVLGCRVLLQQEECGCKERPCAEFIISLEGGTEEPEPHFPLTLHTPQLLASPQPSGMALCCLCQHWGSLAGSLV